MSHFKINRPGTVGPSKVDYYPQSPAGGTRFYDVMLDAGEAYSCDLENSVHIKNNEISFRFITEGVDKYQDQKALDFLRDLSESILLVSRDLRAKMKEEYDGLLDRDMDSGESADNTVHSDNTEGGK